MKILVIGGGGREHALAWKAAQSERVETVYVAPGNAGTAREPGLQNVAVGAEDIRALLEFARAEGIDLTLVGPEAPLGAGVVDEFTAAGLPCFGPTRAAAQLEGSKAFTKDFLQRHNIPTAAYGNFTDVDEAIAYVRQQGAPIVVKADGLAAGGYPDRYRKGDVIEGLPDASPDGKVFHAGTAEQDGQIVTSGGRVLCAVGLGDSVSEAQQRAATISDIARSPAKKRRNSANPGKVPRFRLIVSMARLPPRIPLE